MNNIQHTKLTHTESEYFNLNIKLKEVLKTLNFDT